MSTRGACGRTIAPALGAALLALSVAAGALASPPPDTVDSVKAYRGANGELVEVVMLRPPSANRALVRVRQADWDHNGLVIPCDVERDLREVRFITQHDGRSWVIFRQLDDRNQLFLPGRPTIGTKYKQKATDAARGDEILAAHDAQAKDGRIALFQRKSYPRIEAKYEGLAREAGKRLSDRCGKMVELRFDWSTFEDEVMAEVDAWKACAPIAGYLEQSCARLKEVNTIVCRMGKVFELRVDDAQLLFTTTPTGKDQAAGFLKKQG